MAETPRSPALSAAYAFCRQRARHYENFPVGSILFPGNVRDHFNAVYVFARTADDVADEGSRSPDDRLRALDAWERELDGAARGDARSPGFIALADTMSRFAIPADPFRALVSAFRQDVTTPRYEHYSDLVHYCERSANPVGEIVLRLFGAFNAETAPLSGNICTGLQLANFWQDVATDFAKGRVYIPGEDMHRFGVEEADISGRNPSAAFRSLMQFETDRTAGLFTAGAPLIPMLHGRLRVEIAWVVASGRAVLRRIAGNGFDVVTKSNRLSALDRVWMLAGALVAPRA